MNMSKRSKKHDRTPQVQKDEPTDAERIALDEQAQQQLDERAARRFGIVDDDRGNWIERGGAVAALKEALGTTDEDFCYGLADQLTGRADIEDAGWVSKAGVAKLNFCLSVITGGKPRNQIAAILLAQIAVMFETSMQLAKVIPSIEQEFFRTRRETGSDYFERMQSREANEKDRMKFLTLLESGARETNRCARTIAILVDIYGRYQMAVGQPMTVEKLTVAQGGQTTVGSITQTGPASALKNSTRRRALTKRRQETMPIIGKSKREAAPLRRRRADGE
jgi:hypothetical protein